MRYFLIIIIVGVFACNRKPNNNRTILTGIWRGVIETQGKEIPFNFFIEKGEEQFLSGYLMNGIEKIELPDIHLKGDSLIIPMHIFDAEIRAFFGEGQMEGYWKKNYADNYFLKFRAIRDVNFRFTENPVCDIEDISGKYSVYFIHEGDTSHALGVFEHRGSKITGSFLTPTGDYRFLDGEVRGNRLFLSAFDGEHAFLFEADVLDDRLEGDFWSGKSWHSKWVAVRDENAELPNPHTLTYLKDGFESLDFTFPDFNGNQVSLSDDKYRNKVVIVQIFGTWCPNCMDETRFLAGYHRRNRDKDFEIIGLAFESKDDFAYASERVKRVIELLDVQYDFLIAGQRKSKGVEEALPMLANFMSYPTTIFIDKKGKVRRIHTGFSGPGTGKYYEIYIEDFNLFMQKLLSE